MSADTKTAEAINFPEAPATLLLMASDSAYENSDAWAAIRGTRPISAIAVERTAGIPGTANQGGLATWESWYSLWQYYALQERDLLLLFGLPEAFSYLTICSEQEKDNVKEVPAERICRILEVVQHDIFDNW